MRRRRVVTAAERDLWRRFIRDATPLPGRADDEPPAPPPRPPEAAPAFSAPPVPPPDRAPSPAASPLPFPPAIDPAGPVDIDRRTWLRLRRGLSGIDGRLDLHGLTQEAAHQRLVRFLAERQAGGARCVLVITGKGGRSGGGEGVLRRMVPRWLDEPDNRRRVVTFTTARPQHGGEGALYVLIRRVRPGREP